MGTVPTERTWTAGEATDYAMLNNLSDCQSFFVAQPSTHVYKAKGLSVVISTTTLVNWDTAYYTNDAGWSVANPSRLIFNTAGVYNISAGAMWAAGSSSWAGSIFTMTIARNSAGTRPATTSANHIGQDSQMAPGFGYYGPELNTKVAGCPPYKMPPISPPMSHIDTQAYFDAGEYIELWVRFWKSAGTTNRNINGGVTAANTFYLSAQWNGA